MGHVAGLGRDHFRTGRRHFPGSGIYDDDLGCPYYPPYTAPYNCTYDY
jgi:hypothetical protein